MIRSSRFQLPLLALAAAAFAGQALAQDSGALLDALVQEGVIKESKAEAIRAKLKKAAPSRSSDKIQLDDSIKEIKISGDARFRYQWDEARPQTPTSSLPGDRSQQRERVRLRIGADAKLGDDFKVGLQLSTGQTSDSDNQTAGATGAGAGFGKFPIYISKAYLGWEPVKGASGVLGKQTNPFYINDQGLVWDYDINPTGLSEKFELHKLLAWSGPVELTVNLGQFIFADNNEGYSPWPTGFGGDMSTDAFLLQAQAVVSYKFNEQDKLTFAPGFLTYNSASTLNTGTTTGIGTTVGNVANSNANSFAASNGTRGLELLLLPGDFTTKIAGIKTKFVWDFSYNLDGAYRAYNVYGLKRPGQAGASTANSPHTTQDDYAWLLGVVLGENKKKGDISFLANYRQTGLTAVDPNLNDSDFAQSKLNTRGFKVGLGYNLSNAVVLSLAYQNAFNLRRQLDSSATGAAAWGTTPANGATGNGYADRNNVQIFQADVTVKF